MKKKIIAANTATTVKRPTPTHGHRADNSAPALRGASSNEIRNPIAKQEETLFQSGPVSSNVVARAQPKSGALRRQNPECWDDCRTWPQAAPHADLPRSLPALPFLLLRILRQDDY
eukprot:CAMPEP_0204262956 /NCGR_PEP_ID=MMETSP0468-20130131/8014_2 /ASSEMBLY_ACC=CAM_ASM_000383 /TAXON_ID=2969 /ORGANISM="Oxyrrhis marina" /LENGTH=115 /DNA_ID=CAMNT_0051237667 /DNA_START=73 /DNA_END=420 /DNA_ORIENTATION=-